MSGRPLIQYGVTVLLCLLSLLIRWEADPFFPPGYPFVSFFPAVILSAFLFGVRPGIVAGVLCGFFAWYLFIPPRMSFASMDRGSLTAMVFYSVVVATDIVLVHLMQSANARLRGAREDVRHLAEERGHLAERTQVLFQELQHRVGNNLQMVGAVLSLQMRNLSDPDAKKALADATARLQVIGAIQRRLYRQDGALVPLDVFLEEMSNKIMQSSAQPGITCRIEAERDIVMRPDSAVPMALILSEAIANALEHGFTDRTEGNILVQVRREDGAVIVTVSDDGVGLPPGFDPEKADSIGLRISRVLARQLAAHHSLENGERGARMTLLVPSSRLAEPE